LATAHVTVASEAGVRATLHDRFGNQLLSAERQDAVGFHLVKTLVPGLYYVRLKAWVGLEGAYRLIRPGVEPFGDAEVEQLGDAVLGHQDVRRLEIAVDDQVLMRDGRAAETTPHLYATRKIL
jgi:hypothetical protein